MCFVVFSPCRQQRAAMQMLRAAAVLMCLLVDKQHRGESDTAKHHCHSHGMKIEAADVAPPPCP